MKKYVDFGHVYTPKYMYTCSSINKKSTVLFANQRIRYFYDDVTVSELLSLTLLQFVLHSQIQRHSELTLM